MFPNTTNITGADLDAENGTGEVNLSPAEREVTGDLIPGDLAGRTVYVPPVKRWRSSGLKALRDGDMEGWAQSVLDDDGWAVWEEVDPTLEEIGEFFESVSPGLGTDQGNSRASRRSLRNSNRR